MKTLFALCGLALLAALPAAAQDNTPTAVPTPAPAPGVQPGMSRPIPGIYKRVTKAIAVLSPASGSTVTGVVTFTQDSGRRVHVVADIKGLAPNSEHAFHIHEFGDCSAADASSAGAHFNPEGHQHGGPSSPERHAGDLGNIKADADGKAHLDETLDFLTVSMGRDNILGRGVVVHSKADDFTSQPAGNAGARVACGVIGVAQNGEQARGPRSTTQTTTTQTTTTESTTTTPPPAAPAPAAPAPASP